MDVPNPPIPGMSSQAWSVAYKLAIAGRPMFQRLTSPSPGFMESVKDNYYPLVMTGCKNTGLSARKFGDLTLQASRLLTRFKGNRPKQIGYILGATQTVQFRDLCRKVRAAGNKTEEVFVAIVILANNQGDEQ